MRVIESLLHGRRDVERDHVARIHTTQRRFLERAEHCGITDNGTRMFISHTTAAHIEEIIELRRILALKERRVMMSDSSYRTKVITRAGREYDSKLATIFFEALDNNKMEANAHEQIRTSMRTMFIGEEYTIGSE